MSSSTYYPSHVTIIAKHLSMREADSALYLAKYAYVPLLVCHDSGTCPQALRLL